MNTTLIKASVALLPALLLLAWSVKALLEDKTFGRLFQLLGAAGLLLVALARFAEALYILPFMHWGEAQSVGHYFDLSCAVAAVTLWPLGYLLHALQKPPGLSLARILPAPERRRCVAGRGPRLRTVRPVSSPDVRHTSVRRLCTDE